MASELEILKKLTETLASDNYLTDQTLAWEYAFNSVTDLVCITNRSHQIKFLNTNFLDKLPLNQDYYINKTISELFDKAAKHLWNDMFYPLDEDVYYGKLFLPELGGWFIKKRFVVKNKRGDVIGYTYMFSDITDTVESQLELERNEELLEGVFNIIPDIIGIQDANHNAIRYNKAGGTLFNVTTEELKNKKCYELLGRSAPCEVCHSTMCKKSKKPEQQIKFIKELDGWFDCRSYPILDDNGDVEYIVEHLRDITELKLSQARKEENFRKLNCIFQRLHFIIAAVDGYVWEKEMVPDKDDLVYSYIDPSLCRDFYKLESDLEVSSESPAEFICSGAIGKTSRELITYYCSNDMVHSFIEICTISDNHCLSKAAPCDYFEMGYIEGDDGALEWIILRVRKEPVFNDSGELVGLLGFADDCSKDMHSVRQLIWQGVQDGSIEKLADTGKAKVYWVVKRKEEAADLSYVDFP